MRLRRPMFDSDAKPRAAFQGVARYVMRVKCAMLAWVAAEACLLQLSAPAD